MKRIALASLVPFAVACAGPLATLPPSDHYTRVESPALVLNGDEQQLVKDINKELDRLGLPAATVGGYECNLAAVMANVALAKLWNGSGRKFATNGDVVVPGGKMVRVREGGASRRLEPHHRVDRRRGRRRSQAPASVPAPDLLRNHAALHLPVFDDAARPLSPTIK